MAYSSYNTEVVADSPLIRYTFETGTSDSGSLGASTTSVSVTRNAAYAAVGSASGASFDGSLDRLHNASTNDYFGDKAFAVEAWFKTDTTGGSYKTIVRRSYNASHFILRVRGGSVGSNDGQLECYYSTDSWSATVLSGSRVDDNVWHHVVISANGGGTPIKMYIDGVNVASSANIGAGVHSTPTELWIGRDYTNSNSAELFKGQMDEIAIYNNQLTATRVSAHYNAASTTNAGYTAQVMTASGTMPGGAVSLSKSVSAQAMTASALMPSAVVTGQANKNYTAQVMAGDSSMVAPTWSPRVERNTFAEDASIFDDTPTTVFNGDTTRVQKDALGDDTYLFKLTNPLPGTPMSLTSVKVKMTGHGGGTFTPDIYNVTGAWSESSVTYNTAPAMTFVETQSAVNTAEGVVSTIDLTNAVNAGATSIGIKSNVIGQGLWYTKEAVTDTNRPVVEWTFVNSAGVTVTILVMSGSGLVVNPVVDTTHGISQNVPALTASGTLVNPSVAVVRNPVVTATPMTGSADGPFGGFSRPRIIVLTETMDATGLFTDTTVAVQRGPKINVPAMTANIIWKQPELVGEGAGHPIVLGEGEDPYFTRVMNLQPYVWWRLKDTGSVADNRMQVAEDTLNDGIYHGVLVNQHDGPGDRHSVKFDGINDYIESREAGADLEAAQPFMVTEFGFRTTKQNQFMLWQRDGGGNTRGTPRAIRLKNGKINYQAFRVDPTSIAGDSYLLNGEFTGFTNLADGNWHHVVIRGFQGYTGTGTEIWVDGKFELRRYNVANLYGFPDYVGGSAGTASSDFFEGDMTEIVGYTHNISHEDIPRNYYAFMGWTPVEVPGMAATATMPDGAKSKGNQKKALYLYFDANPEQFKPSTTVEGSLEYDPMTQFVSPGTQASPWPPIKGKFENIGEYHGYKVFAKSVRLNYESGGVQPYRDPYTDEPSLINLETDVDLDDFDVIMFKDWPDESGELVANQLELDFFNREFPGQVERLVSQLRDANDKGIGLFVTNPRMAVDLGIVDRVEFVPTLTGNDGTNSSLAGDYGSAVKFPWDIAEDDGLERGAFAYGIGQPMTTTPAYLTNKAKYYSDTNKNDRFRVTALVDGLTDIPSYMIKDAVYHTNYGYGGWTGGAYKYLHRLQGLQLGDEYIFNGTDLGGMIDNTRYSRANGTVATPLANVKAGTVVTTFGATHWVGKVEVNNPYRDYATTIVLDQGEMLAGRPVGGRIFVNFTEMPSYGLGVDIDVLPGSEYDAANPFLLNPEELEGAEDTSVFNIIGTPEQIAITEEALSRCTFPYQALQNRIQNRWGKDHVDIVWDDIDPAARGVGAFGVFEPWSPKDGQITIDEEAIRQWALTHGQEFNDLAMTVVIHETAHLVDHVYLQPYQRVNIWNVFHDDWNTFHKDPFTGNLTTAEDYILPADYNILFDPIDHSIFNEDDTPAIHNGEYWLGAGSYMHSRVGEAFGDAFVQAYTDIPMDAYHYLPHPAPEFIGPMIREAIETGPNAYLFNDSGQVETGWPLGYPRETEAQREWERSWTRTSLISTSAVAKTTNRLVRLPDGTTTRVKMADAEGTLLVMTRSSRLFPVINMPRWEMGGRGMYWLSAQPVIADGDKVIRAQSATASATMPSPMVTAEKDNDINAQAMLGTATLNNVAESTIKDVNIVSLPMEATAQMVGYGKTISVPAMEASATMVENFNMVHASGDHITLTFHGYNVTLYMKEKA